MPGPNAECRLKELPCAGPSKVSVFCYSEMSIARCDKTRFP